MSCVSSEDRLPVQKCSFEVYRSEADALFFRKKMVKAIKCYTQALEKNENDLHCLLRRSECYKFLGNLEEALRDVDLALSIGPNNHRCLAQKAEVLYTKGEFESSLIFYHRGFQLRPEIREFRIGIQKCEEAIQNSVACKKLRPTESESVGDKASRHPTMRNKAKEELQQKKDDYPMHLLPKEKSRNTFGYLHDDHEYMKKLLKHGKKWKWKTECTEEVNRLVREGLDYLDNRSEFWFEVKPVVGQRRVRTSTAEQERKKRSRVIVRVLEKLHEIDQHQQANEHVIAMKLADQLRQEVGQWTEDEFPDRLEVLANVNSLLGLSQLELSRYDEAMEAHTLAYELGQKCNLPEVVSHAMDNIGRVYAKKGDYEEAIKVWENKLGDCDDKMETIWLRYEIGRCHLELQRSEQALEHGDQALTLAQELNDASWQLNLNVLIGQANMQLARRPEAHSAFYKARELARFLKAEKAEKAILDVIDEFQSTEAEVNSEMQPYSDLESGTVSFKSKSKSDIILRFQRNIH